jgi:hypothetical protein
MTDAWSGTSPFSSYRNEAVGPHEPYWHYVAIGSGLRWIVTALALVGSASVVLVQGTKDPSNPIPPYQTCQQPLPSNTTPPTWNVYRYYNGPFYYGA